MQSHSYYLREIKTQAVCDSKFKLITTISSYFYIFLNPKDPDVCIVVRTLTSD